MSTTPTLPTVVEPSGSELQFFPPKEHTRSYGIDATPDDGYPLRILVAHRDSCRCEYAGDGPLPGMMNEWNRKRAGILDRAIAALGGPVAEPAGSEIELLREILKRDRVAIDATRIVAPWYQPPVELLDLHRRIEVVLDRHDKQTPSGPHLIFDLNTGDMRIESPNSDSTT